MQTQLLRRRSLAGRLRGVTPKKPRVRNKKLKALYDRCNNRTPERKAKMLAHRLAWKQRNIEYVRAADAWRRSMLRSRHTPWVDREAMRDVYALAAFATRTLGKPYEVDHIVPLKHPLVCGLHVPWNLQVICRRQNRSKRNRHWPEMP